MHQQCFECDRKQVNKIKQILSISEKQEKELEVIVNNYIKTVDMNKTNPEVMGEIWKLISNYTSNNNPYKEVKSYYNQEVLKVKDEIQNIIYSSNDIYYTAIKIAVVGNLIDFSANHQFDMNILKSMIYDILNKELSIDDSAQLKESLSTAKSVLYIGDNCGEIVLDKMFIEVIKKIYPQIHFYYGVRGQPIINDVTIDDATEVNMHEIAEVISNGDGSLGTVLEKTSHKFQEVFKKVDLVICKGQGNYEGLISETRNNLYFMFMAKCNIIAEPLGLETLSIVCMKKK
ncbi:MAG: ARMT1-like domain-containing protein [Coprobacillus sp.]